jgi:hypothetical protein
MAGVIAFSIFGNLWYDPDVEILCNADLLNLL